MKELEVLKHYANESIENICDKETINNCYDNIKQALEDKQSKLDKIKEVIDDVKTNPHLNEIYYGYHWKNLIQILEEE